MNGALFIYYLFCSSAVFVYGIGLKQSVVKSNSLHYFITNGIKVFFTVFLSAAPIWWIIQLILIPYNFAELYPVILILVVLFFSQIIDGFFYLIKQNTAGILLPSAILLLAINESTTLQEVYIIMGSIIISVFSIIPILYSIRKKMVLSMTGKGSKIISAVFFSALFVFFALYSYHISWLNFGE